MIERVTRTLALAAVALLGCGSKPDHPPAQIIDLTTSTQELLRDFDAHANEPRFVTILAPS
jgi:hypothetical protein